MPWYVILALPIFCQHIARTCIMNRIHTLINLYNFIPHLNSDTQTFLVQFLLVFTMICLRVALPQQLEGTCQKIA